MEIQNTSLPTRGAISGNRPETALRAVSEKLEATFISEMLKASGLGKARSSFGGGAGEEQFSSFLVQKQAEAMVQAGGIGLSETLFQDLLKGQENG